VNDCNPEMRSAQKSRCGRWWYSRPVPNVGKADALGEETSRRTEGSTGGGVQASGERFVEITSGRSMLQPGLTATGKDLSAKGDQRGWEEHGLAHERVVAMTAE